MRLSTIPAYLVGNRRAILEIAADRMHLGIAALLVLSAALARNYDRVSLLDEPWRLAGPFVASLVISGPLFLTVYICARLKGMKSPGMIRAYLSFLTLYWMTAPMAWLYGIPYERFCSPPAAISANLWTLALVSAWRIALMTRVVSVVFTSPISAALSLVMLVADIAALISAPPCPASGHQRDGRSPRTTGDRICGAPGQSLVLGLAANLVGTGLDRCEVLKHPPRMDGSAAPDRPGNVLATLAFAVSVPSAWAALLPFTQPEQRLSRRVEQVYRSTGPAAALALISAHSRAAFPPDWQPPPRTSSGDPPTNEVLDTLEALADHPHPDWLGDIYTQRFRDRVHYDAYRWPNELLTGHAVRLAAILSKLREGPEMARSLQDDPYLPHFTIRLGDKPETIPKEERAALETLRRLGESSNTTKTRDRLTVDPPESNASSARNMPTNHLVDKTIPSLVLHPCLFRGVSQSGLAPAIRSGPGQTRYVPQDSDR